MFDGDVLIAVTDWELAHWGDVHDDLAWLLVRDNQERFPNLADRLHDYEPASGRPIDADAAALLPRARTVPLRTIGTLAGLRLRDPRGEIAWQLIYNTLHTRLLAEAARRGGWALPIEPLPPVDSRRRAPLAGRSTSRSTDLRDVMLPCRRRRLRRDASQGRRAPSQVPPRSRPPRAGARPPPSATSIGVLLGTADRDVDDGRREICAALERWRR